MGSATARISSASAQSRDRAARLAFVASSGGPAVDLTELARLLDVGGGRVRARRETHPSALQGDGDPLI